MRSPDGQRRVLAGVCGGLATKLNWNVSLVRVLWLVITLIPVLPGLPLYLVLWWVVPLEDGAEPTLSSSPST